MFYGPAPRGTCMRTGMRETACRRTPQAPEPLSPRNPHTSQPTTPLPLPPHAQQVFERLKDMGLLMGKGGLHGNVFRIKPPMCWTPSDAEFCLAAIDAALSEL